MVCPKCGRELGEGKMYCEHCGEEIRIVPDFVPEIETSIEENLSNLASEVVDSNKENDHSFDTSNINVVSDELDDSHDLESHKSEFSSRWSIVYVLSLVVILLALVFGLGIMIYHDNSASFQVKKGDEKFDEGHYRQAIGYYEKAVDLEPDLIEYRMRLADCYLAMENIDMAVEVYKDMIISNPSSTLAYAQIIALYEKIGDYSNIDNFLMHNANDEIREEFIDYLALEPEFSLDEGSYDEETVLTLTNISSGTIYYTTDGSVPDESSTVYREPIPLVRGTQTISAFFANDFGVCSSVVSKTYDIMPKAPVAPLISLESGSYDVPQIIKVVAPDDCNVYYTIDGTEPDRFSRVYGEPIPIEIGASHYNFVAIDKMGVASETISRDYSLNILSSFEPDQGLMILYQHLAEKHYIKDETGTSEYYPGIFSYLYSDIRYINGISMYCYNEYYVYGSSARAMTSNIFGVNIITGEVYLVKHGTNDNYTCEPF